MHAGISLRKFETDNPNPAAHWVLALVTGAGAIRAQDVTRTESGESTDRLAPALTSMSAATQEVLGEGWKGRPLGGIGHGPATALERHYRPDELAEAWGLSVKVVREIFSGEPGVLRIDRPETRNKRGYCTMRIPESVVVRVHKRLTGGSR